MSKCATALRTASTTALVTAVASGLVVAAPAARAGSASRATDVTPCAPPSDDLAAAGAWMMADTEGAPLSPAALQTIPVDQHTIIVRWEDNRGETPAADYLVSWARGRGEPSPVDDSAHATEDTCFTVSGLTAGVVYTFAVWSRAATGQLSRPAVLHAATRRAGFSVLDNNKAGNALGRSYVRASGGLTAAATMLADGHLRALFDRSTRLEFNSRAVASGGWTKHPPELVAPGFEPTQPAFADGASHARFTAAWVDERGIRVRTRASGKWQDVRYVTQNEDDALLGLTADRPGRVHLLLRRSAPDAGLYYVSRRSGGGWTLSHIAGTGAADTGLLARDPVTDDVVLVVEHATAAGTSLRYAVLGPRSTKVAGLTTWLRVNTTTLHWTPTSVTSFDGRITLAVQRTSNHADLDGPYLLSARGATHHGPFRVRGTDRRDSGVVVSQLQRGHVVLSWRRTRATWAPTVIGVYVAQWSRAPKSSSGWTFTPARQWTRSAYDFPVAAFRDDKGHLYLACRTATQDVTE